MDCLRLGEVSPDTDYIFQPNGSRNSMKWRPAQDRFESLLASKLQAHGNKCRDIVDSAIREWMSSPTNGRFLEPAVAACSYKIQSDRGYLMKKVTALLRQIQYRRKSTTPDVKGSHKFGSGKETSAYNGRNEKATTTAQYDFHIGKAYECAIGVEAAETPVRDIMASKEAVRDIMASKEIATAIDMMIGPAELPEPDPTEVPQPVELSNIEWDEATTLDICGNEGHCPNEAMAGATITINSDDVNNKAGHDEREEESTNTFAPAECEEAKASSAFTINSVGQDNKSAHHEEFSPATLATVGVTVEHEQEQATTLAPAGVTVIVKLIPICVLPRGVGRVLTAVIKWNSKPIPRSTKITEHFKAVDRGHLSRRTKKATSVSNTSATIIKPIPRVTKITNHFRAVDSRQLSRPATAKIVQLATKKKRQMPKRTKLPKPIGATTTNYLTRTSLQRGSVVVDAPRKWKVKDILRVAAASGDYSLLLVLLDDNNKQTSTHTYTTASSIALKMDEGSMDVQNPTRPAGIVATLPAREKDVFVTATPAQNRMQHPPSYVCRVPHMLKDAFPLLCKDVFERRYNENYRQHTSLLLERLDSLLSVNAKQLRGDWTDWVPTERGDAKFPWQIFSLMMMTAGASDVTVAKKITHFCTEFGHPADLYAYGQVNGVENTVKYLASKHVLFIFNRMKSLNILKAAVAMVEMWYIEQHPTATKLVPESWADNPFRLSEEAVAMCPRTLNLLPESAQEINKFVGSGKKITHMTTWGAYNIITGVSVDRHVRRFAVSMGHGQACLTDDDLSEQLELAYERQNWIRINEITASVGQLLTNSKKNTERVTVETELRKIGKDLGLSDEFDNFIQHYK